MPLDGERVVLAGMACRYPDADDPAALLQNTLDGRQSFRPIPPDRLALADYASDVIGESDSITRIPAGLISGWHFDTARFRIPRAVFEGTDLAHWLALEVAADAIASIGGADRLDRETTVVLVANTLTGEFSRATSLRLRWPWLDRRLEAALFASRLEPSEAARVRAAFRDQIWTALRTPDEETLAGGLSNTIAGRIANQFDLHGGAYTVDAACASSLVAVADAATMIASGRACAAIVAAVDLSLDPFELVGFSRNGALAKSRMRVFDARAEGFWPGEGAGAVVLMAESEARRIGVRPTMFVAGCAVSTDGSGGLTRPDVDGQRRAIARACAAAGVESTDIGYVEAHGTGTPIGDPTEVQALAAFVGQSRRHPIPIASIKGNIGHTKAAAGLAGLIRTAGAMTAGVIPPHIGCERVHPIFAETGDRVRVVTTPEPWPPAKRVAGVSSFGFGGVNAHVVLRDTTKIRARPIPAPPSVRDSALFLFRGPDRETLRRRIEALAILATSLSYAEVADAAANSFAQLGEGPFRLAFSASTPGQLGERLKAALAALDGLPSNGIRFARFEKRPRIGLLFPGQAAPVRLHGGAWARLFPGRYPELTVDGPLERTDNAQPAIVRASLAGLELLDRLGIVADAAIGHSLGELSALSWAGALPKIDLVGLAAIRGQAMAGLEPGAMLQLGCDPTRAQSLAAGLSVCTACHNAPDETVMSGSFAATDKLEQRALRAGIACVRLAVSHAFHSPEMAGAAEPLSRHLSTLDTGEILRPVASTVTGSWLPADTDLRELLVDQLIRPVRFTDAVDALFEHVDVLVEVGPGTGLGRLLAWTQRPVLGLDTFSETTLPLTNTLAELFSLGVDLDPRPLFQGPGIHPLPERPPELIASPCGVAQNAPTAIPPPKVELTESATVPNKAPGGALPQLIRLVANQMNMPETDVSPDLRFDSDLNLSSIAVNRLIVRLAKVLGRAAPGQATDFSKASLSEAASMFDEMDALGEPNRPERVAGPAQWVRRFRPVPKALPDRPSTNLSWSTTDLGNSATELSDGLLIELTHAWDPERDAFPLLLACQEAANRYAHLAIAHTGAPLSGFARSIAAENLFESVRLLPAPADPKLLARQVPDFEEIMQFETGILGIPELEVVPTDVGGRGEIPGAVLVTGGARGIGAECAIRLAERHGCPLVLVGRSAPNSGDVRATLDRIASDGGRACYVRADVAKLEEFRTEIADAAADLGPITHLVHAAGFNEPAAFKEISRDLLSQTIAAKSAGLRAAIDACGTSLRRVIAFGSIIGRMGLAGEAHYALANAEQTRLLGEIARSRGELSALSIEWSVWSGAGMGERLGAIERLAAAGVDALTLGDALDTFESLALSETEGFVVVSSRFGMNAPVQMAQPLRFVERTQVHTPGVELVAETRIGLGRDLYLADHQVDGAPLMPGVMMLEAMAQAAYALEPEVHAELSDIRFDAAVHVGDGDVGLRVGSLKDSDGCIRTEVRSDSDSFRASRASAIWHSKTPRKVTMSPEGAREFDAAPLYGPLFFHGPRFQKLASLGSVSSREVEGWFDPAPQDAFFSTFEPRTLLLGDPSIRDASLHALQCCVPHRRLIPVSAAQIQVLSGRRPVRLQARENWSRGTDYCFDILLADRSGRVVENWRDAQFRSIGEIDIGPVLEVAPGLARAWLERRAREATGDDTLVLVLIDDVSADREARRHRAAAALGLARLNRRGDGKPLSADAHISFAHSRGVTVGVRAARQVGCDIEEVAAFAAQELALAWTAEEVLRKMGSRATLGQAESGLFTGDSHERIAAFAPVPTAGAGPVAVAIGTERPQ